MDRIIRCLVTLNESPDIEGVDKTFNSLDEFFRECFEQYEKKAKET